MDIKIKYVQGVYEDAEDSWTLQAELERFIRRNEPETVLDVGTGTGILGITAAKLSCRVFCSDVDFRACKLARANSLRNNAEVNCFCSDLLTALKPSVQFDLIVFNPPYLPEDEFKTDRAVIGGVTGIETFALFLEQAKLHTKHVLFVYSSLNPIHKLKQAITANGFKLEELARKRFGDEDLYVGLLRSDKYT